MSAFIVSDHEAISFRIREVLLFSGRECPESHFCKIDQASSRLAKEQPSLIVLDFSKDPARSLSTLEVLRGAVDCRILAVGPGSESKLVLKALRSGADDFVDAADLELELQAALVRASKPSSGPGRSEEPGRLITLLAPNGGGGSSTLAVNLSTALALQHKSIGLFDMKFETGDLSALLDLRPTFTLADLCPNASKMDRVMLERSLVRHDSGVHLLAAPLFLSDIRRVTVEGITQSLSLARVMFPYVVVDLDHSFREEQEAVLRLSDIILLIVRLDFASLRNARRTLEHLERMEIDRDRVHLVVNRHGQAKEVPASMAEEAMGKKIFHFVPDDPWTINRANNNGIPAVLESPKSKVSRSVSLLAKNVNGRHKTG